MTQLPPPGGRHALRPPFFPQQFLSVVPRRVEATLLLTAAEREALDATLETFAKACRAAIHVGLSEETTSNIILHRLCYHDLRKTYGLTANLTVRAIARAARLLKAASGTPRPADFDVEDDTIAYDARTLSYTEDACTASLSTVKGRLKGIALHLPEGHRYRLTGSRLVKAFLHRRSARDYHLTLHVVPR